MLRHAMRGRFVPRPAVLAAILLRHLLRLRRVLGCRIRVAFIPGCSARGRGIRQILVRRRSARRCRVGLRRSARERRIRLGAGLRRPGCGCRVRLRVEPGRPGRGCRVGLSAVLGGAARGRVVWLGCVLRCRLR